MRKLFDYCNQLRPYADSYGECLIEIEEGDNKEEIIESFLKTAQNWFDQKYLNPKPLDVYAYNGTIYKGNLVLFETRRYYLD